MDEHGILLIGIRERVIRWEGKVVCPAAGNLKLELPSTIVHYFSYQRP